MVELIRLLGYNIERERSRSGLMFREYEPTRKIEKLRNMCRKPESEAEEKYNHWRSWE